MFEKAPDNITEVVFQDTFQIACFSRAPVVYPSVWDWKKDGKPLFIDDVRSKRITCASGRLIVRSAVLKDSGKYTCTLVNSAGSVESTTATVVVKG